MKKQEPLDVPGIDDCDYLYVASSDAGSVYIRVQMENDVRYWASVTVDAEHFCDDLETGAGPFQSPEEACRALSHYFDWHVSNNGGEVELCGHTKKALGVR